MRRRPRRSKVRPGTERLWRDCNNIYLFRLF
jgi:hypothetical protein